MYISLNIRMLFLNLFYFSLLDIIFCNGNQKSALSLLETNNKVRPSIRKQSNQNNIFQQNKPVFIQNRNNILNLEAMRNKIRIPIYNRGLIGVPVSKQNNINIQSIRGIIGVPVLRQSEISIEDIIEDSVSDDNTDTIDIERETQTSINNFNTDTVDVTTKWGDCIRKKFKRSPTLPTRICQDGEEPQNEIAIVENNENNEEIVNQNPQAETFFTTKKKDGIYFEGFEYRKKGVSANRKIQFWQCTRLSCNGRAHSDIDGTNFRSITPHNHYQIMSDFEVGLIT